MQRQTQMETTPRGMRKHIALIGQANAGKSTLFNLLTGQENAIVSDKPGTTTDPVLKNIELLPFGPVTLIDTAGLGDDTELGKQRTDKTCEVSRRADVGIVITDATQYKDDKNEFEVYKKFFSGEKIYVFSKCDLADKEILENLKAQYPDAIFVSKNNSTAVDDLKNVIIKKLINTDTDIEKNKNTEDTLIGDLLPFPYESTVIMIVTVDSESPKGRLILPQVQFIRDCLDHGIKVYVTRETELKSALENISDVALVVTDSQVFAVVDKIVPQNIPLTSFSMLLAHQKGNFKQLMKGVEHIKNLKDNDKILMLEACTHNHTHEDIGRVKIPSLINKRTGKKLEYDFYCGYSMPDNLEDYAMAILCGSCMINKQEVSARLNLLEESNVQTSNYGIVLAYLNGVLDRCRTIFDSAGK